MVQFLFTVDGIITIIPTPCKNLACKNLPKNLGFKDSSTFFKTVSIKRFNEIHVQPFNKIHCQWIENLTDLIFLYSVVQF